MLTVADVTCTFALFAIFAKNASSSIRDVALLISGPEDCNTRLWGQGTLVEGRQV